MLLMARSSESKHEKVMSTTTKRVGRQSNPANDLHHCVSFDLPSESVNLVTGMECAQPEHPNHVAGLLEIKIRFDGRLGFCGTPKGRKRDVL